MEGGGMNVEKAYVADGLRFTVNVDLQDPAVTTLIGAAAVVLAQATVGGQVVEGIATITSATAVRCVFAPGALAAGVYSVQVRVEVSGQPPATVWSGSVNMLPSIDAPD
jgi:hypothetical protein